jgi:hypothetical protein
MKTRKSTTASSPGRKRLLKIALVILAILLVIRLLLPYIVLDYTNKKLAHIPGYFGHIQDIDLSLYRGAYVVKDIYIDRVDSATQKHTTLFECPKVDISLAWAALFRGRIVTEFVLSNPVLRFTEDKTELNDMEKDTSDFRQMLRTFTPFKVNFIEVFNGEIAYLDNTVNPVVDVQLDQTYLLAKNLSNVLDTSLLPASIKATANVYGGTLDFNLRLDALAKDPTFDMNMEVKNALLPRLNDFFKAYAKLDIHKGTFGMYMEMAAQDKKFIGYVKPFIADLDVTGPEDKKDSFLSKLWESLVQVVGGILENNESDKIATKVPIVGEYGNQTIGTWYAIFAALRNGFVQAIYPALDNQVNLGTLKAVDPKDDNKEGFFKRVFGKPGENKQDKKKKKDNKKG